MNLVVGLYAEGRTDERFLPILIQRTAEQILIKHDSWNISAEQPIVIEKAVASGASSLDQRIYQAAKDAHGYHILVVHSDSDDRGYEQTIRERFEPGYTLVQQEQGIICKHLVPIIPVRMVEAWMLADVDALKKAIGSNVSLQASKLPTRAKQVEAITYPKDTIKEALQLAYPHRPKEQNRIRSNLYASLAPVISLERLNQVPSYQKFVEAFSDALRLLNFIY